MLTLELAGQLPTLYKAMESLGVETGAFSQLTRSYMAETFNPKTPDVEGIRSVCFA